ncbi:MAG TPA: ribonuclease HII, partial [Myxococcota bacterium]|nr:ribonuclease HII [Myxococcota bacterium]
MTRTTLAALRAHALALETVRQLRRFAAQMRSDERAGAVVLGLQCGARADALCAERRRLAALFARRARLLRDGARAVAGVDEVGMGPMAGPIVACAVVFAERPWLPGLRDSKQLTAVQRERLAAEIRKQAIGIGLAEIWPAEIDRLNVYRAGLEAMRRAVLALDPTPDHLLVDARTVPGVVIAQTPLVRGDSRDGSIAAASVVAKVHRDALMEQADGAHPGYGFARHKGYCTRDHVAALRELGPTPLHRRSFA